MTAQLATGRARPVAAGMALRLDEGSQEPAGPIPGH
jgi:hypothetical protein